MEQWREGKVHQRKEMKLLVQLGKELREGSHCHPLLPGAVMVLSFSLGGKRRGISPSLWLGRFRLDSWERELGLEDRAPEWLWDPHP